VTPKIKIALVGLITTLAIAGGLYFFSTSPTPRQISFRGITLEISDNFPTCLKFLPNMEKQTLPETVTLINNCADEFIVNDIVQNNIDPSTTFMQFKIAMKQNDQFDDLHFQTEKQECTNSFKKSSQPDDKIRTCGSFPLPAGAAMQMSSEDKAYRLTIKGHFKDNVTRKINFRLWLNSNAHSASSMFT